MWTSPTKAASPAETPEPARRAANGDAAVGEHHRRHRQRQQRCRQHRRGGKEAGREAGHPPADDGDEHPGGDPERHEDDGKGLADLGEDQPLRHGQHQAHQGDRQQQPAADARNLRQTLAVESREPEGENDGERRQDRQEVPGVDGVTEGEHHHHHDAP